MSFIRQPKPYDPHDYQRHGIKFCIENKDVGLILRPGFGKTSIVYAAFKILRAKNYARKMLVIAPLRPAQSVWPGEQRKWTDFHDLKVTVLHGKNKDLALASDADVYVINPEGLPWLFKAMKRHNWWWDILVVDESTQFKSTTTERFKCLKGDKWGNQLRRFKRRMILTGSFMPNSLLDVFGQVYILDLGAALGQFVTHYKMNWFYQPPGQTHVFIPHPGAFQAIQKKISPMMFHLEEKDYLKLPPLIEPPPIEFSLSPEVQVQYDQMETLLLTQIEQELVSAANAGVAMAKCKQIAAGGIFHEGGEKWTNLHYEKANIVAELVEELAGKPLLVAYEYKHDLQRLREVLGADVPHIGGGVPQKRFREVEEGWNAGQIPVLLAQPQSVAFGLNLQDTPADIAWHTLPTNLLHYEQLIRRIWRQGQSERVVNHKIVARGSVDEVLIRMLAKKDYNQSTFMSALVSHLKHEDLTDYWPEQVQLVEVHP